jgi:hypothetical protein
MVGDKTQWLRPSKPVLVCSVPETPPADILDDLWPPLDDSDMGLRGSGCTLRHVVLSLRSWFPELRSCHLARRRCDAAARSQQRSEGAGTAARESYMRLKDVAGLLSEVAASDTNGATTPQARTALALI